MRAFDVSRQFPIFRTMTPQTQQAWIVERQGLPKDALRLHTDWPVPDKPEKGEVLVKVQAVALNPL